MTFLKTWLKTSTCVRPVLGMVGSLSIACLPTSVSAQNAASDAYYNQGQQELARLKEAAVINAPAKNIIIFIGDGMGVSTLTAARIYDGQKRGLDGESYQSVMDGLAHTALVKTYSHDGQVSDSSATATAFMSGVKTLNGAVGVGLERVPATCAAAEAAAVPSVFERAKAIGKSTGIITTTTVTHATPASTYAHAQSRNWENDARMPASATAEGCRDIARQLMEWDAGNGMDVIMGGGRQNFMPKSQRDPEYATQFGARADNRNLIKEWQKRNRQGTYAWNKSQFEALDAEKSPRILALFEKGHMHYEADRANDEAGEPSLAEMTRKGITALSQNPEGYVLLVEGGRIDHGHHAGNARRALEDANALDLAVKAALDMVDLEKTLIIVTSDHSHTLNINGYPARGNSILGTVANSSGVPTKALDGKSYTTLSYANGPGAKGKDVRHDPAHEETGHLDYLQPALVPLHSETHSGEDVVARASGPMAHLFRGTIEQNTIAHIMADALALPPVR